MNIVLIGAPGSGKTWLASQLSAKLKLHHIEADQIFWSNQDLRAEVQKLTDVDHWVFEGHISKVADVVLPKADKVIVVEHPEFFSLVRAVKRDWKNLKKVYFNIQNYEKMRNRREEIINSQDDVIYWKSGTSIQTLLKKLL